MYDGSLCGDSLDLIDPLEYEFDRFCLDPDKPFTMNMTDEDLANIAEQGLDRWLKGLVGIL